MHTVLARVTNEICAGRLGVSKTIKLATFIKERDDLISLLLLNYHPHWLLLALSLVLGVNIAAALDDAVETAGTAGRNFNHEQVLMQVLENALRDDFLADAPSDDIASREKISPKGRARDRYNAIILRRTLVVIFLLDAAKRQRDPIIKPDPPLFRATSSMTSSVDMLRELQNLLLNDHGDIVRFLHQRGYHISYESPVYEPFGNLRIVNLSEDMRDGTRLCKLASIMRRDHHFLTQVIRVGPGHRPSMALAIKKQNITSALNLMKECLPENLQAKFQWHATAHDIASGNLEKTIALLWQIAALWMEYVVVDVAKLREELGIVQNGFRIARRNPNSPSNNVQPDLTHLADSPSKLQIIESCTTDSGDLLLKWCATLCGIYGVEIRDFTEDFRDGAVLCLILHHYCPDLMRIDEINRIPAGDQRGAFAAEAEHKHVQKNLDLFMDRCRLLGTLPEIFLSAEATLAPAFRDSFKEDSVGRVMQLLVSYLFRRMMMQKRTADVRREVFEMMENNRPSLELQTTNEIDPMHETQNVFADNQVTIDPFPQENPGYSEKRLSANSWNTDGPTSEENESHGTSTSDESGSEKLHASDAADLSHVYTRMRHVQSRRATRPRASQLVVDRENAARVILRHYRGYKARKEYETLKKAIVDLQSSFRAFLGRHEVRQLRDAHVEEIALDEGTEHQEETLSPLAAGASEQLVESPEELTRTIDEDTRSLPVRIGWQILEFIPAFRRHVLTMESYSQRMLAHERAQKENEAATVIQSAWRLNLARKTRVNVDTQRNETRRTWLACAVQAATTAVRIADEHRRELFSWRESIFTNALSQAEQAFSTEMLRAKKAREEDVLQRQRFEEANVAQEKRFASELQEHRVVFEADLAGIHQEIKSLQTRTADMELSPIPPMGDQHDKIIKSLVEASTKNDIQDEALRLIYGDLNMERDRADRLESDLQNVRDREFQTKEDILQQNEAWQERFKDLEADIQQAHGTLLTGAICIATAQYRLHMATLSTARRDETHKREKRERLLQNEYAAFNDEEKEGLCVLTTALSQYDEELDRLNVAKDVQETWATERDIQETRTEQYQSMLDADLDILCTNSRENDKEWNAMSKEFDYEVETIAHRIHEFKRDRDETDHQNESLDIAMRAILAKEHRQEMEDNLCRILESAEERFYAERYERYEENENNIYCRHEIDIQLELEDQEEVLENEEFENGMESIELNIDSLESDCFHADEHLGLLDSYIAHLCSESPSIMIYDDIPDVLGEELSEDVEECFALHRETCQLMEEMYVDASEDDQELQGNNDRHGCLSEEVTPKQSHDLIGERESYVEPEDTISDASSESSYANSDLEGIGQGVTLSIGEGLYDRLVDEEVEYYNGRPTRDVGVQTGSGPITPFASPDPHSRSDFESPYLSDDSFDHSENETTSYESQGETSPDEVTLTLAHSNEPNQNAHFYDAPIIHGQNSSGTSPYAAFNTPLSQLHISEADRESLPIGDTPLAENNGLYSSSGPLDTLAQLALQDASDMNVFVGGSEPQIGALESEARLPPLIHKRSDAYELEDKENLQESNFSASKSGDLKIYGLRRESDLGSLNSPLYPESREIVEVAEEGDYVLRYQRDSVDHALDEEVPSSDDDVFSDADDQTHSPQADTSADLSHLSMELSGFNIQPHRMSVERVVQDPSSASKLASVMRRISIAASSPNIASKSRAVTPKQKQAPHRDIIRTILILIRYCSRSGDQLKLRELGISILSDFCVVHQRTEEIMAAEECVDVLTTCVQYHRDQDSIFFSAVRVLWEITLQPNGKEKITGNQDCVRRLQSVNEILESQALREQRNLERIKQANMIVDIVRKRRAEGGSLKSMTDALRSAKDQKLSSQIPRKDSHRLLSDLVDIISA